MFLENKEAQELENIRKEYFQKYSQHQDEIFGVVYPKADPSFILKSSLKKVFGHILKRGSMGIQPENVLMVGPQGCGKTETAMQFAAYANLPLLKINCALIREPRDWFGCKTAESGNVKWVSSEFARLIERGGAVVLLDEISRATPPVLNSLLPLLDATGFTFLEEVKQVVKRGKDVYFFATANIGNEFTGSYGKLDKALDDRFAVRVEADYLKENDEIKLLVTRTNIDLPTAAKLVKIANYVRGNSSTKFGGKFSSIISTRNLLDAAVLYKSLGKESFEYSLVPLFSAKGGTDSQQASIRQFIQSQFGSF